MFFLWNDTIILTSRFFSAVIRGTEQDKFHIKVKFIDGGEDDCIYRYYDSLQEARNSLTELQGLLNKCWEENHVIN